MSDNQQNISDEVPQGASSDSASSGTHWAYEKYFTGLRPSADSTAPKPLYDIDAIASKIPVEDEDDLGDDGKPFVITIKS